MFNGYYGNYYGNYGTHSGNCGTCCGQGTAINFLNGIGIGTLIYVWFDSSGFIQARYEGMQSGVVLFTMNGRTIRIPENNIIAVAT